MNSIVYCALQYNLANMSSADSAQAATEPLTPTDMLQRHEQQLTFLTEAVRTVGVSHERAMESLRDHLLGIPAAERAAASASSPPPRTSPVSEARLPPPERCSGAPGSCRPFLTQCSLAFELQPSAFPSDRARVAYVISLLTGRAKEWGTAEWQRQSPICSSFLLFSKELRKVFDHATPGREAAQGLMDLKQGGRSVADYSIDFRTIAADSGWNAPPLLAAFYHGLSDRIKDELAARDLPAGLDDLIALSIRIDGRLRERQRERRFSVVPQAPFHRSAESGRFPSEQVFGGSAEAPEPMQLGRARLSTEERQRRLQENRCLYCGQSGHFVTSCPVKEGAHQSNRGRW